MATATCDACGKGGCKLLRCNRCRNAWFCGRECQIIAARQGHSSANCRPTDGARTLTAAEVTPRVPDAAGPSTTAVDSALLVPAASSCHACGKNDAKLLRCGRCWGVWFPATASARTLLEKSSATGVPTAAPQTERRDLFLWRARARPLQLRRDPPRQLTLQVCASAYLICTRRAAKRACQTRGSATSPQWRMPRRWRRWQTSSAARRVPAVVQGQTDFFPTACSAWETRPLPRVPLAPRSWRRVCRGAGGSSSNPWSIAATWRISRRARWS